MDPVRKQILLLLPTGVIVSTPYDCSTLPFFAGDLLDILHELSPELSARKAGPFRDPIKPRPPRGSKKWNPPNMNPLLHWGNKGIIKGVPFFGSFKGLGKGLYAQKGRSFCFGWDLRGSELDTRSDATSLGSIMFAFYGSERNYLKMCQ